MSERIKCRGFDILRYKPETLVSPIPVLVAPGFGTSADTYGLLLAELQSAGFVGLCPDYRWGATGEPKKLLFLPDVDRAKYQALLATIEHEGYPNEQGVRQVNVIAHSKGAIDIISVARNHPENFRNILLVAPGGVRDSNKGYVPELVRLAFADRRDRRDKARVEARGGEEAEWLLINKKSAVAYKRHWVRYFLESITATKIIYQDFQYLRARGIRIALIAQESDSMFPLDSYLFVKDNVDSFVELPGIHAEIKFNPAIARRLIDMLKTPYL